MQLFLDTVDIETVEKISSLGIISGITTNPSLVANHSFGTNFKDVLAKMCSLVPDSVSVEVTAKEQEEMKRQALTLKEIHDNITIKLPMNEAGIAVCHYLTRLGVKTNLTLCFSVNQALLAAKAGATYVSPFIGRLEDNGQDGVGLVSDIVNTFMRYDSINTKVLAASIRNAQHIEQVAKIGADVATIPPKLIYKMFTHELTNKGLEIFSQDISRSKDKYNF